MAPIRVISFGIFALHETARRIAAIVSLLSVLFLPPAMAQGQVDFGRDILPLLSENCFQCHGPDEAKRKAGLRLDTRDGALRIKDGIAAVVPGASDKSEIIRRVVATDSDDVMPPPETNRTLSEPEITLIRRWIDEGARWTGHWAFQKLGRPALPSLRSFANRVINPIDRFVFKRLEQKGLSPSPHAAKETLIRRATLDLTGLPPAPDEVDAFLKDDSADAFGAVVDRLLRSPAFGERMAWGWLDAARYADSNGYQGDRERTMWPWRDWVVDAFNQNLPFDTFTVWQLAGDLLPDPTLEQKLATGFSRNHMINGEGGRIPEENRVDYVMDMMETTGTVWLGLTLNCSRCHDHKFDPLTRKDYYRFFAFFNQTPVTGGGGDPQTKPVIELPTERQKTRLAELKKETGAMAADLARIEEALFQDTNSESPDRPEESTNIPNNIQSILDRAPGNRSVAQLKELEKHFKKTHPDYFNHLAELRKKSEKLESLRGEIVKVMVMEDMPKARKTFMLEQGLYDKPGEEVSPGVPAALHSIEPGERPNRLSLARWLISPDNPLTARVVVNRIWQQFFGIGLVKTAENFGVQGEFPSHPRLLDWLAFEFIESGWNMKQLCRLIVTSATYRQESKSTPELNAHDPENRLLARGARFRMPSWMIRDQALAASGLLTKRMSGSPVNSYQPEGIWEEATFGNKKYKRDSGESLYRRSLYLFWRRIVGPTVFFDSASRQTCAVKLPRTNSPLHALTTLNDVTYVEAARAMAERVLLSSCGTLKSRIELAFRLVLARRPTPEELALLESSYDRLKREFTNQPRAAAQYISIGESKFTEDIERTELAAMTGLCSAILNLDEAVTKE